MNSPFPELVQYVNSGVNPGFTCHPTTIAYILSLLLFFIQGLKQKTTIKGIDDWINKNLTPELRKSARSESIKALINKLNERGITIKNAPNVIKDIIKIVDKLNPQLKDDILRTAREAIIEYLIAEILDQSGQHARDVGDTVILPWDVKAPIGCDTELSQLFGIECLKRFQTLLPVTIVIGDQTYDYELTEEFTCGLLLFSAIMGENSIYNVSMFGVFFTSDYILSKNRFTEGSEIYTVEIADRTYTFNTTDFMRGFSTGALWTGVDHHNYWKNLKSYANREEGEDITF